MTRIAYISDLHIDHVGDGGKNILAMVQKNLKKFDILVIAGDISNIPTEVFEFMRKVSKLLLDDDINKRIVFVPGNHEYYTFDMELCDRIFEELKRLRNVKILGYQFQDAQFYNHVVDYTEKTDILFVGGTMWTDFSLRGDASFHKDEAHMCMLDFKRIYHKDRILVADDTVGFYEQCTATMQGWVMASPIRKSYHTKIVAVTHHTPSINSVHEKYESSSLNPAFTSGILDIKHPSYQSWTSKVDLWIHGHTHDCHDYVVEHGDGDKTRVLCNPRGYRLRNGSYETEEFSFKIVEI